MKNVLIVVLLVISTPLLAQSDCACCSTAYQQFDFWLGEWTVYTKDGNKVGENSISKIEDNCIMTEHWKGAKGLNGTSINYFDRADSTWNQTWVDNKGSVLRLKGELVEGKMVLKSELLKSPKGDEYYNQITWSKNEDGTVTQLWEAYAPGGALLKTLFKGIYHRKE